MRWCFLALDEDEEGLEEDKTGEERDDFGEGGEEEESLGNRDILLLD